MNRFASPWRLGDLMSLVATLVIAATAILVGWIGVSAEPAASHQTGWLNVGIGGLVIAGIGTAVWLMTARRAIGERRRHLLPDVVLVAAATRGPQTVSDPLVVLPGMTRYHRSSCELVAGKDVKPVRSGRRAAALTPCGVCRPDLIENAP